MYTKNIFKASSYENLPALKQYMRKNWKLHELFIEYNPRKGLPPEDNVEDWPFEAIFTDEFGYPTRVRLFSLTCGYGGEGPRDLLEILKFLGIKYDEDDILTTKKMGADGYIRLCYTK